MASEYTSAGTSFKIFHEGEWHELIIRTRKAHPQVKAEELAQLTQKTIGLWLRVWRSVKQEIWQLAGDAPEAILAERIGAEPMVTVFNKKFDGLSITVNSSDSGQSALDCVMALIFAHDDILDKMPQLFSGANVQAPANPAPAAPAQPKQQDINNVDDYIPPYAQKAVQRHNDIAQAKEVNELPFRHFKQLAPNIIQVQEFVQGGGEKYQKSAIAATQPYHKSNPQYDDDSLVYYTITGEIQIKEGQYGRQAIIPTDKGKIYVDATNKAGEESPDWHNFAQDLRDEYQRLANDDNAKLFAPGCLLVMKASKQKDGKQWKNYYHCYQPLQQPVLA
jgi:hypothetical protein